MTSRRSALLLVAFLLVPAGLAGCSDDGDDDAGDTTTEADDTTTEADDTTTEPGGDTTTEPADPTTTAAPDGSSTSEGGSTTSPNLPPNDSPLAELLLDPAVVGTGFAPDDTLGDGSLDTDLCEDITLEETWDDQAAQALLAGSDEDSQIFQQAILRFPDADTATAFATELGEALVTCQPETETEELDGIGDSALLATVADESSTAVAGIVRVGDLVAWHLALTRPGAPSYLDEDILTASAERLVG